jgi:hypothetical protein
VVQPQGRECLLKKTYPEIIPGSRDPVQVDEIQAWDQAPPRDRVLPELVQVRVDTDRYKLLSGGKKRWRSGEPEVLYTMAMPLTFLVVYASPICLSNTSFGSPANREQCPIQPFEFILEPLVTLTTRPPVICTFLHSRAGE